MNKYEQRAHDLFNGGYNCAQAVFAAFADEMNLSEKEALRIASPFGGGMGRLREVCGAVSGMFMVLGYLYGYDDAKDDAVKKELYSYVQSLADKFKDEYKTIICRELLGVDGAAKPNPEPTPRSETFYKERPCLGFVVSAAGILADFIGNKEI